MEKECFDKAKELIFLDGQEKAKTKLIKVLMLNHENLEAEELLRIMKDMTEMNEE